jgi:hypothetical protein
MNKTVTYFYRGPIEVPVKGSYRWVDGYSQNSEAGNILYPWESKKEIYNQAKDHGLKIIFKEGCEQCLE